MASSSPLRNSGSDDEPLTPAGRMFLRPEMNTIIHCAIGLKHHMDIQVIKSIVKNSIMVKHPRFCSLLVRDKRGVEHWRRTEIDIDQHVIVVDITNPANDDEDESLRPHNDAAEKIANDYIAELAVTTPLGMDKPLWEIHILKEQKCIIFRIHHALGDGMSLMSLFLASCRKAEDPTAVPTMVTGGRRGLWSGNRMSWWRVLLAFLRMVLLSFVFCLEFTLRLWVPDRKTVITGGEGVELWPRKLVTARFWIEDMKAVKKAVPNATINDVLFGVISSGLSRYLNHRTPNALKQDQKITGLAMVNLRQPSELQDIEGMTKNNLGSWWGNKFGVILLPAFYQNGGGVHPLEHVKKAKAMTEKKKQTLEAYFSYKLGDLIMSLLGSKAACWLNYRIVCNTTFTISNVVGPKEELTLAGNPITFIRVNTSSLPHALTMHMLSYAGRADMQILVAKDLIPDPEFLVKCFEESLLEMKEAAAAAAEATAKS